ncbi:MAG: AAA-like domain-containing protein [Saprospiraceae bacterium]|nr:AAA-like domain-containing protein [Saprospiraceae bacterium]MDW8230143.1 AAA-like domain-containing protein [Saprospiraceae bacterium]
MREFNTSGPNIPERHYTIERRPQIVEGLRMVEQERYFTICAPRQTGKNTCFRQLAVYLQDRGYEVAQMNFENYRTASVEAFLYEWAKNLKEAWGIDHSDVREIPVSFSRISEVKDKKWVLIVDEVEGINPEYFSVFLHSIRNLYHSRQRHALKSVILVGVTNILGVVSNNASPFNIADNLELPYFTEEEVYELLGQHETETGQQFDNEVKHTLFRITAGQPGLVNGFARQLVTRYANVPCLNMEHYRVVEDWYIRLSIDKNFENILNKAREERAFVERLLFTEDKIPFRIDQPAIKLLHTNGLIKDDGEGYVTFWVPFYKKRLHNAFYPYSNGEKEGILRRLALNELLDEKGKLQLDSLIEGYKAYVKRRGFNAFREKDEKGQYLSLKESALVYSFETYIQAFLQAVGGKSYREAHTGLGRSDLIIHVKGEEYLLETKIYYYERQFLEGRKQLAYYCRSLGQRVGVYLVFCPNNIRYPDSVKEGVEVIEGVEVRTYLVEYDEEKW